jgi:hypothetical protein
MSGICTPPGVGCKMTAEAADDSESVAVKMLQKARLKPNMRD